MDYILPKPHLSISQIKLLKACPRKYYFNYVEGLGSITPYLVAGGATHTALEKNYIHKIETGEDLPLNEVLRVFQEEFARNKHRIDNWVNKSEEEFVAMGRAMLAAHMKHLAGSVDPISTEMEIRLEFDGVPILGYVDLETSEYILDHKFKFSAKNPLKNYDPDEDMQLTLYAFATGKKKVGFNLHWFELRRKEVKDKHGRIKRDRNGRPVVVEKLWPVARTFTATRKKEHFDRLNDTVVEAAEAITKYTVNGDFPKVEQNSQECYWCEFKNLCWGKREETDRRVWETLVLGKRQKKEPSTDEVLDKLDEVIIDDKDVELPF